MCFQSTREGATRPLTTPNPACRLCNGRGYLLVPTLNPSDLLQTEPCPKCYPYVPEPIPWRWVFIGGIALGLLAVMVTCLVLP